MTESLSENIKRDYYEWLLKLVGHEKDGDGHYFQLLRSLHGKTFYSSVEKDSNRISDGASLRDKFAYYVKKYQDADVQEALSGAPSVLEVLIALAYRMEKDILHDDTLGDRTDRWFWMMIENLKLDILTDEKLFIPEENDLKFDWKGYFEHRLSIFLDRNYRKNGQNGGLFPCKGRDLPDFRKLELWNQMNCYILERLLYV